MPRDQRLRTMPDDEFDRTYADATVAMLTAMGDNETAAAHLRWSRMELERQRRQRVISRALSGPRRAATA